PGDVTLIRRGAGDRIAAGTHSSLATICLRARVTVITCRAVRLRWVGASSRRCIAGPGDVTLIRRAARDRVAAGTHSSLAGICLRARVAVVTRRPVRRCGVRASTGRRIARAGDVTLIQCGAGDGSAGGTDAVLTGVILCTGIAVAAGDAVGDVRVR